MLTPTQTMTEVDPRTRLHQLPVTHKLPPMGRPSATT